MLTLRLVAAVRADEPIGISSHWGGLGGGAGGWRLSPALVSLLGAVAAWLLCGALGVYYLEGRRARAREESARADAIAASMRDERHRAESREDDRARIKREERRHQEERADRIARKATANEASTDKASQRRAAPTLATGAVTPKAPPASPVTRRTSP